MKIHRDSILESYFLRSADRYSPDGETIAFASSRTGVRQIHLLDLATRRVTSVDGQPSVPVYFPVWSPDGRRRLMTAGNDGDYALYVMDVAGGRAERLVQGVSSGPSSWSPHGDEVAYSRLTPNDPG